MNANSITPICFSSPGTSKFMSAVNFLNSHHNYSHAMSSHALHWNYQTRKKTVFNSKTYSEKCDFESKLFSPELHKCYFLYVYKQIRSKVPIVLFPLCL